MVREFCIECHYVVLGSWSGWRWSIHANGIEIDHGEEVSPSCCFDSAMFMLNERFPLCLSKMEMPK